MESGFVIHRQHVEPPGWRLREVAPRQRVQVVPDDLAQGTAFLTIDGGFGRLHVASGAGLDLDEAEHVAIPADKIDLTVVARRTVIARDYYVATAAQVEIGVLLTAATDLVAERFLAGCGRRGNEVQNPKHEPG